MYVKNRMTKQPVCIDVNSKISQVVDIMNEKNLHRIPVVSGKKLVGLVTESMISKNGASKATSLSIYELNYLLSKTSVDAIMIRDVITVHEDRFLEDAALLMYKHDIGCCLLYTSLPVDHVCADAFAEDANTVVADNENIPADYMGLDIGPKSVALYKEALAGAKTVV